MRHVLTVLALVGLALAAGPASADKKAAEANTEGGVITVALKSFKFTPAEGSGADLFGHNEEEGKLFFYTNGAAEAAVKLPAEGEYTVTVRASGETAMNVRPKFKLSVDGKDVGKETSLTADEATDYTFTAKLDAGERKLKVAFTNDTYKAGEYDSNLYVHAVTLTPKKAAAPEKK